MTGGQALARQLVREGVEDVFGLPGDQTMHALDALYDEPSIRFITTRHEQGTTYLADGYARGGGRPGVAFVVPGVGVYNAGRGARHRVRRVVAGGADRRPDQPRRDRQGPRAAARDRRPARPRAPHHVVAAARAHRRRDPRHRARGVRARAARPAAAGRDRDAAGGVLRARRRHAARPAPTTCATPPTPSRSPPPRRALAAAERPLIWAGGGVVLGDASRRAHRGRRAPAGAGGHDAPGQGRDRRSPPALRRHDVGQPPHAAAARRRRRVLAVGTHFLGNELAAETDGRAPRRRRRGDRSPLRRPDSRSSATPRPRSSSCSTRSGASGDPAPSRADEIAGVPQAGRGRPARRRPAGPHGRPAPRRDPRRRCARAVHHHDRVHEPHALPGVRAAHLPVDLVHGHARVGASPPRSA